MLRSVLTADQNPIMAFPNPTNSFTRIELVTPPVDGKVWLVNTAGQKLLEFSVKDRTVDIDLGRVASGTYLLTTSDGRAVKVVKQ
ncbi:T9SS type A sorting domain-containing protein [Dyadobacter fermentans]|uniref:Secretion system C-terminal sorting domain-containing protein n=1 Tax=Dyadobacter fermentans (strain ATCC 700827 / DSM 18053 / CIP 107007 / KCTC 52180 / NS114) TaxID=471854 RepID=C6VW16_DYAFD|nr:T9SS type A sorting domain-containing protein [Dyadobacter fermentans]ACT93148.1 conserved hypothetical protein [Dyadobacter fermentans DSM 18053]